MARAVAGLAPEPAVGSAQADLAVAWPEAAVLVRGWPVAESATEQEKAMARRAEVPAAVTRARPAR